MAATASLQTSLFATQRTTRVARRGSVAVRAQKWYPGAKDLPYLKDVPGSYSFDPLRLGAKPELLEYFSVGEVINGRWAMAAVAGILAADLLGRGDWWTAGAQEYSVDIKTQLLVGIPTFVVLEGLRAGGMKGDPIKFQDPAGMDSAETRLKELKNGRLAMLAFLGFSSQAAVQGMGPIECLQKHLEDPAHNNIYTSAVGNEAVVAVMALSVAPMIIEAKRALSGDEEDEFRPIPW